ncbi:MAG: phosphotransferase [Planctomycetota bacterium]|jgi:aminoglycoside phosphotransferase (APT) family kinase protein
MRQPWEAERTVDPELARKLIREQAPEVGAGRIELLGEGWDNVVYRVDDSWVFRFPRRQMGADLLANECAVLPRIAARLPVPVPVPTILGQPTAAFAWPFAGYRFLPGRTACGPGVTDARRRAMADPLGRFLAALHATPPRTLSGEEVPGDEIGRMDLDKRLPQIRQRFADLVERGVVASPDPWLPLLRDLPRGPRPRCLVHGDLYVRHLLVDDRVRLCGVIDWGDVHLGDPACDLMIALSFLPADARADFSAAYGTIDEPTWRLARFRALQHTATITMYGFDIADEDLFREGKSGLERLARDAR